MDDKTMQEKYSAIIGHARAAAGGLQEIVGDKPDGLTAVNVYEAARRMEDFVSRVNNIFALLSARTDEAIDKLAAEKLNGTPQLTLVK